MGIVTIVVQNEKPGKPPLKLSASADEGPPQPPKDEKGHMLGRLKLSHPNGRPPKQRNSYEAVKTDQYEKGRNKGDLWLILSMLHGNTHIYVMWMVGTQN